MRISDWSSDVCSSDLVVEVGGSPAQRREAKAKQEAESKKKNAAEALALDLVVEAPQRIFVRGRGLEAEWAGKLTVAGTTAEPRINGELHIVRGDFRLAGDRKSTRLNSSH